MRALPQLITLFAWVGVSALAVASLTPGNEMVRTGLPGTMEHLGAYLLATAVCLLAYPRASRVHLGALLIGYAGLLEFAQLFVGGRHSRFIDFAASSCGVLIALGASLLVKTRQPAAP